MKVGGFEESIRMYGKALSLDLNFVASHVGIGNNYLGMGKPEQARAAFARIATVARNSANGASRASGSRQPTSTRGRPKKLCRFAGNVRARGGGRRRRGDVGDLTQMGDVLREAGRTKEALAKYEEAVTVINKAKVPEEVKEGDAAACNTCSKKAASRLPARTSPRRRQSWLSTRGGHPKAAAVRSASAARARGDGPRAGREAVPPPRHGGSSSRTSRTEYLYLTAVALKGRR